MKHRLPAVAIAIRDDAVASVGKAFLSCDASGDGIYTADHGMVALLDVEQRFDVFVRDDQRVRGGRRVDVSDREQLAIVMNLLRRDLSGSNPAK